MFISNNLVRTLLIRRFRRPPAGVIPCPARIIHSHQATVTVGEAAVARRKRRGSENDWTRGSAGTARQFHSINLPLSISLPSHVDLSLVNVRLGFLAAPGDPRVKHIRCPELT